MEQEETEDHPFGRVCVFSAASPRHPECNEDAAAVVPLSNKRCVLAVADGVGGHDGGRRASHLAIATLVNAVTESYAAGNSVREAILSGFEQANERILGTGTGGACTLIVICIDDAELRSFHVGDAAALVFGGRGARRLETIAHSPVGYAVKAGVIDESQALEHAARHLVSNVVGTPGMHVDMSAPVMLRPLDTVVLASDGLFDNARTSEVVEALRCGPLNEGLRELSSTCRRRMVEPESGEPGKPDDMTIIAFRRTRRRYQARPEDAPGLADTRVRPAALLDGQETKPTVPAENDRLGS